MSDDGDKDTGPDEERPSRPESAADRRARRKAARESGADSGADDSDAAKEKVPARSKASAKGSSAESVPSGRKEGAKAGGRAATDTDRQPLPKRIVRYLREVVAELRKVIWPTRKQMVVYTAAVLAFVVFMVSLVSLLDWAFGKVVFALFG